VPLQHAPAAHALVLRNAVAAVLFAVFLARAAARPALPAGAEDAIPDALLADPAACMTAE